MENLLEGVRLTGVIVRDCWKAVLAMRRSVGMNAPEKRLEERQTYPGLILELGSAPRPAELEDFVDILRFVNKGSTP